MGPNGAGKTTLLHLAVGLLVPTAGTVRVLDQPAGAAELVSQVGFVAQDTPLYRDFTAAEHLTMGRKLNHRFDEALGRSRLERVGVPLDRRVGLDDCLAAAARVEFIDANPNPEQAPDPVRACQELAAQFANRYGSLGSAGILLWFLPLFAGLFWGRRWWPARSSTAPTGWCGRKGSAGCAGRWPSSAWSAPGWCWRPRATRCWRPSTGSAAASPDRYRPPARSKLATKRCRKATNEGPMSSRRAASSTVARR